MYDFTFYDFLVATGAVGLSLAGWIGLISIISIIGFIGEKLQNLLTRKK